MKLLQALCERLTARLPVQRISGHDGSTYLERYTLLNLGPTRGRVYLHRFLRGDEDRELHNHPWYALSLILVAGYLEERRRWTPEGDRVDVRRYRPGRFNVLAPHTFHRVELDRGPCWTLIATGPVVQSWGFWDRGTGRYLPWREFVRAKGMVPRGEAAVAGADAP